MEGGNSWFYLTLWRGTPPEFTSEISTEIVDSKSLHSDINVLDLVNSEISMAFEADVDVNEFEDVDTKVITITEVVWFVGR